jgi:hypothetical protein
VTGPPARDGRCEASPGSVPSGTGAAISTSRRAPT